MRKINKEKDFSENVQLQLNESITIQNILYYQLKSKKMAHYRILWDGTLGVQGTDWISFHVNLKFRYDMSELNPKGDSYFEITNGLGFSF